MILCLQKMCDPQRKFGMCILKGQCETFCWKKAEQFGCDMMQFLLYEVPIYFKLFAVKQWRDQRVVREDADFTFFSCKLYSLVSFLFIPQQNYLP